MFLTDTHLIYRGIRPLQRLGVTAKGLVLNNPLAGISVPQSVPKQLEVIPPDPWPGDAQHGRDMIAGVFRFAGQSIVKENLSWEPDGAHEEWTAALHGFEWLRNLRSVGGDRARRMAREMVSGWLAVYTKHHDLVWRADVTGVRLTSWISFHDFFCASADDDFRKDYFTSLIRQAKHLARILPAGLEGIPLMKAVKGLAFSGLALEDGEERLAQAFKLMRQQIKEQILPDGSHISRSPQSTFEFLQVMVDLRAALISAKIDMPEELQHAIDRVTPAVKFFRHGDGALAHFNGAQEGNSHLCETTLMHSGARGKAMKSLVNSGYERLTQGRSSLIMDTGLPVLSKYSDRAHAGLLSFEYSFGRDRVIVNCGTSEVQGQWRNILRSTAAHSTVTVDNRNACQFDEKGLLTNRPEVEFKRHEDEEVAMIDASHTGYVPRMGLVHRRCVRLLHRGETLVGEDQLTGKSGVDYAVRFHLHTGIQASLIQDGEEILLRSKSGTGWRFKAKDAVMTIEDSIYAGEGEIPRRSMQIVLTGQTVSPSTIIAWELKREKI